MEREQKRYRTNSTYSYKDTKEAEYNKENAHDYNIQTEEVSYRNRSFNNKSNCINQQIQHHHLLNNSYKNLPKLSQPETHAIKFTGNQIQDLYDKLKADYTKLMIDFQREQMECNNLKSQNRLDTKKLNELDKIVAEQQQEIVTLNNEIQLQVSQNNILRDYLREQENRVTKITAENTTLNQELSSTRPLSLKNKSYTSVLQQNDLKYEQILESKEYLERQNDQLQQNNSRLQQQNKEIHEQLNHVKMQFCNLENHSQQMQRNLKQLELESSQSKINESLLQKSYQKLQEDYREMQNMNINLQEHNKQLGILIQKLEDKIKIMEEQCNNTIFWEQTAKEYELKSLQQQEEHLKSNNNIKEMENYMQKLKIQMKEEREKFINEIKSYKQEIQLHREKNDLLNKNLQQFQKEYSNLKSQQKQYQSQSELIKNLKDTLVSVESSLSRETKQNEERQIQIKEQEQSIQELKKLNNDKQEKIIKLEDQILELNSKQQPILDISNINKEQNNSIGSTNLNETQLNYISCNSNKIFQPNNNLQIESYSEMQDKIRKLEQVIFDLKNQISNQQNMHQQQPNQQIESSFYQQIYAPPYINAKNASISNSPLHKNYLSSQYASNNNHNIHSYHNSSFNISRPTIEIDRNQSHNNSFHYRKNSNDGSSFLEDFLISYMNGSDNNEKYFKTKCEVAKSPQFKKQNYGTFDYDSLNITPPSDPSSVINIGYFPFNINIPHFEREMVIDTIYLRSNLTKNIVYSVNENDFLTFQLTGNSSALNYPCSNINGNLSIQQFFRARFYQNQTLNNPLIIRVSEQMENNTFPKSLLLSSLQVNINTCHPSCLACSGPNKNQCLKCQESNPNNNNECSCSNSNYFFQNGNCVDKCDNENGYFQKYQSSNECYYINNECKIWNNALQKCDKCLNPLLPQTELCVTQCSPGFQKLQIGNTVNFECVFIDRNKEGQIALTGLHNNFFSQFEIERLGFTFLDFKQINTFSAIHSNCGGQQLLGGFFINKKGSTIQYLYTKSNQYQQVKVYFKYFLIDYQYQSAEDSQISIQLNEQNKKIYVNQIQFSSSYNVCGLEQNDIIGEFEIIANVTNHFCEECQADQYSQCTKCKDGYFLDSGKCKLCDLSCKKCFNAQTCEDCLDINANLNSKKECQCPTNQYFDNQKLSCTKCSNTTCDQCLRTAPNICTSCQGTKGLLQGDCLDNCGQKYFNDLNVCSPCIQNCIECADAKTCKTCDFGFFLLNTCIETCPERYFQNTKTNTCEKCEDNCLNCNQQVSKCTKCSDSFLVSTSFKCVQLCEKDIEYNNNGVCSPCASKISNCFSCQNDECIICKLEFYLSLDKKQCLSVCPVQQVGNSQEGKCIQCAEGCAKCDEADIQKCSSCIAGYFLENGQCKKSCESINFANEQTNECQPCNIKYSNCKECDSQNCKSCDTNSNFKFLDIKGTRCIQKCDQGQYPSTQFQCQNCKNKNCYTCHDQNPNQCIDCIYIFAYRYYFYQDQCYQDCPNNTYLEINSHLQQQTCQDCSKKYKYCTSCTSSMCTQCENGYCIDFQTGQCISNGSCQDMGCTDTNCLKCDDKDKSKCIVCKETYFLLDNQCQPQCKDGYYEDLSNNECIDCKKYLGKNCTKCRIRECLETDCSIKDCQSTVCKKQFYDWTKNYQDSQCVDQCPDNLYPNQNNICIWCYNQNCKQCDPKNPQNCTSCFLQEQNINFLLQESQCVSICSKGYYQQQNNCLPCKSGCLRCTEDECQECKNNNQIINPQTQECVDQCQNNYFPGLNKYNQQQCMKCSQLFEGCENCDSTQCNKCLDVNQVFDPINNKCTATCPKQYYQKQQMCIRCADPNCQECDNLQPNKCTSCFSEGRFYFFQKEEGKCVDKCSSDEYLSNNECIKCSKKYGSNCSDCNNTKCIKCYDTSFFISISDGYSCVSTCPQGEYGDSSTQKCSKCKNKKCNQCDPKDSSKCLSCVKDSKGYPYLYEKDCIKQCLPKFYFNDDNICYACESKYGKNCIECDQSNCKKCDISSQSVYLQKDQNKCVERCTDKYYSSSADNLLQCLKCPDDNCLQCNPNKPKKCDKCVTGFYFNQLQQSCVNKCEENQYGDDITSQCIDCNKTFLNCDKCTASECLKCQKDYFKVEKDQNCYAKCPYNNIDKILVDPKYDMSINKQCQKCQNKNCAVCDPKKLAYCLVCSEEHQLPYFYKNDCIQECKKYQKADIKYCYDECPKQLAQDEKTNQCIECPKFVQNKECVEECKKSTYINPETPNLCVDCEIQYSKNCSICDISQCKQCANQNYLYESKCFEQCPQNTYIQENQMICTNKCDPPQVIQDKTCQKKCHSGYFILKQNDQQVCKKCSGQCKECERTSDTCTECFEGEEQDCFNQKSIKYQAEKLICKQLNYSDLEKCEEAIQEQSQTVSIFSYVVLVSLLFSLLVVLLSHSFNSTLSLVYLQNFQMLANYALLTSNKLQLIKEMALRFLLNYNVFQMMPNPFQNDKNSRKLTNFSIFESILPYSNLSKSSFENVFFQVCFLFTQLFVSNALVDWLYQFCHQRVLMQN
ncbi:hypothetical protein ABPG72_009617 [Tetrahymena utriculariae]